VPTWSVGSTAISQETSQTVTFTPLATITHHPQRQSQPLSSPKPLPA
jgi:hypothetical protein